MKEVYIPSSLDIKKILISNPPKFKYDLDKFYYLIGLLIILMARRKSNLDEEYVALYSPRLQSKIRDYNYYLEYLVQNKILETNNHYEPGKFSRGYKIVEKYLESEPTLVQIKKFTLIRRTRQSLADRRLLERKYGHLTKWINEDLKINYEGAMMCLNALYERELKYGYKPRSNKNQKSPKERYFLRRINLERFAKQDFEYSVDDTSYRFHSNLTSLKSELRNYVTYAGQQLCSVDIKNSQPFLSMILFNPLFYTDEKESFNLKSISPSIYYQLLPTIPHLLSILPNSSTYTMLVKSHESECSTDLELYCTLVDKGRLYPYLAHKLYEETGINFDMDIPDEKRELKGWFFWILYSPNKYKPWENKGRFRRLFKRLFPNVYNIFFLLKKDNYKYLPVILQLVESEIVINKVTRIINKEHPNIPIFTIHDSVITLADCAEMVKGYLKMEFEKKMSLQPSLALEMLSPDKTLTPKDVVGMDV